MQEEDVIWVNYLKPQGALQSGQTDALTLDGNWVWKKLVPFPKPTRRRRAADPPGPHEPVAVELASVVYAAPPNRTSRYRLCSKKQADDQDPQSLAYTFKVLASVLQETAAEDDEAKEEAAQEALRRRLMEQEAPEEVPDPGTRADEEEEEEEELLEEMVD